jgi:hypothetical protein
LADYPAGRHSQKPLKKIARTKEMAATKRPPYLRIGAKCKSCRFGMLVDTAFGELRQRLVCIFLFGEGGIKQLHRLAKAERDSCRSVCAPLMRAICSAAVSSPCCQSLAELSPGSTCGARPTTRADRQSRSRKQRWRKATLGRSRQSKLQPASRAQGR